MITTNPTMAVRKPIPVRTATITAHENIVQRLRNTAFTLETTAVMTSTSRLAMNGSENTEAAKQIAAKNAPTAVPTDRYSARSSRRGISGSSWKAWTIVSTVICRCPPS